MSGDNLRGVSGHDRVVDRWPIVRTIDRWDPTHAPGSSRALWTTDNVGEANPGVLSPLNWSIWGTYGGDAMVRESGYQLGILTPAERAPAVAPEDSWVRIYHGRAAMQVTFLALFGDRMPGTSGEEVVGAILGRVPEDMDFRATKRRYPVIAWRLPYAFLTVPGRARRAAAQADTWWRTQIPRMETVSREEALAFLFEGSRRFGDAVVLQSLVLLAVVQPLYGALAKLVERVGQGDVSLLSGSGGPEMAIVEGIWKVSRGQAQLGDVIANHGFHGPLEGEISTRVWREDDSPLRQMVSDYAARGDAEDPLRARERREATRQQMCRDILAALPRWRRPGVRLLLRLAAHRILLRGVVKRAFLQDLDVARAAARRAGRCFVEDGLLDDVEDIFYLTLEELGQPLPADAKALVARRRSQREQYRRLRLPARWVGLPEPIPVDEGEGGERPDGVAGIGVSPGVVDGTVRVVTDPSFAEVEPGEILVATTTDPSWSTIMFVSAALVVDIGGALSHAAVVARELGIPCVVNTRSGTRDLRTGDRVRVDGQAGTVEILQPAP
jgi:pyruvate,water dikinase